MTKLIVRDMVNPNPATAMTRTSFKDLIVRLTEEGQGSVPVLAAVARWSEC